MWWEPKGRRSPGPWRPAQPACAAESSPVQQAGYFASNTPRCFSKLSSPGQGFNGPAPHVQGTHVKHEDWRGCPTARVSVSVHILKGRSFVHLFVWIPQEADPGARGVIY